MLPHITGVNEARYRLVPSLLDAKVNKKEISLSLGKTLIPIMDVTALVEKIYQLISDQDLKKDPSIAPLRVLRVEEIADLILGPDIYLASFGGIPNRENEFFKESELCLPAAYGSEKELISIFNSMEIKLTGRKHL